jgi:hypothetical protein
MGTGGRGRRRAKDCLDVDEPKTVWSAERAEHLALVLKEEVSAGLFHVVVRAVREFGSVAEFLERPVRSARWRRARKVCGLGISRRVRCCPTDGAMRVRGAGEVCRVGQVRRVQRAAVHLGQPVVEVDRNDQAVCLRVKRRVEAGKRLVETETCNTTGFLAHRLCLSAARMHSYLLAARSRTHTHKPIL